jgi:hypothetical protein
MVYRGRNMITALYAVLTGTTKLMEEPDAEEAYAIPKPAFQLMIDAVHQLHNHFPRMDSDPNFQSAAADSHAPQAPHGLPAADDPHGPPVRRTAQ